MTSRFFGIPSHPLLVHIPAVLLPLCALLAILIVVRPRLEEHFGIPLVVLTAGGTLGAFLAAASGEGLEEILREHSAAIEHHAEWGDRTRIVALLFFVITVAFVVMARKARLAAAGADSASSPVKRSAAVPVLAALLILSGVATTASVIITGHSGAKSAWEDAGKEG